MSEIREVIVQRFAGQQSVKACHQRDMTYRQKYWFFPRVTCFAIFVFILWAPFSRTVIYLSQRTKHFSDILTGCVLLIMLPYCWPYAITVGHYGVRLYRAIGLLICAYLLAFAFNPGIQGPIEIYRYIPIRMLFVLASCLTGYYLSQMELLKHNHFRILTILIVALYIINIIFGRFLGATSIASYPTDIINVQITDLHGVSLSDYLLASCLVGIAFWRFPIIKYGCGVLVLVMVMLTFRRGATLCAGLSFLSLAFIDIWESRQIRNRVYAVLALFVIIIVLFAALDTDILFSRWHGLLEGQNRSYRDQLYLNAFRAIVNDPIESLFGHGLGSTVTLNEKHIGRSVYVHNDLLELTYTAGLPALLAFMYIHISCIRIIMFFSKRSVWLMGVAMTAYINLFIAGMFQSCLASAQESAFLFMIIGFLFSQADKLYESC